MIQEVMCESINMEAVRAYQAESSSSKYRTALQCIVDRCLLDSSVMRLAASSNGLTSNTTIGLLAMTFLLVIAVLGVACIFFGKRGKEEPSGAGSHLVADDKVKDAPTGYDSNKLV